MKKKSNISKVMSKVAKDRWKNVPKEERIKVGKDLARKRWKNKNLL